MRIHFTNSIPKQLQVNDDQVERVQTVFLVVGVSCQNMNKLWASSMSGAEKQEIT